MHADTVGTERQMADQSIQTEAGQGVTVCQEQGVQTDKPGTLQPAGSQAVETVPQTHASRLKLVPSVQPPETVTDADACQGGITEQKQHIKGIHSVCCLPGGDVIKAHSDSNAGMPCALSTVLSKATTDLVATSPAAQDVQAANTAVSLHPQTTLLGRDMQICTVAAAQPKCADVSCISQHIDDASVLELDADTVSADLTYGSKQTQFLTNTKAARATGIEANPAAAGMPIVPGLKRDYCCDVPKPQCCSPVPAKRHKAVVCTGNNTRQEQPDTCQPLVASPSSKQQIDLSTVPSTGPVQCPSAPAEFVAVLPQPGPQGSVSTPVMLAAVPAHKTPASQCATPALHCQLPEAAPVTAVPSLEVILQTEAQHGKGSLGLCVNKILTAKPVCTMAIVPGSHITQQASIRAVPRRPAASAAVHIEEISGNILSASSKAEQVTTMQPAASFDIDIDVHAADKQAVTDEAVQNSRTATQQGGGISSWGGAGELPPLSANCYLWHDWRNMDCACSTVVVNCLYSQGLTRV